MWNTEKEYYLNAGERNIREAELTDIYYELEEKISALDQKTLGEYEKDMEELVDKNYKLAQENHKLREILSAVSEAVNDTWC